ncbi:MAG: M2 family metallopeptidase, partial [Eubacteriaceae bacterium]|nr:M2 family metallopeptidase [Eubacteriaceae bacterium]
MEEFKTFGELKYTRPDFGNIRRQLKKLGRQLKNAADYESFRSAFEGIEQLIVGMYTDNEIVSIRNTCDKTDAFYENEQKVLTRKAAVLALSLLPIGKNALKSPFRADFDAEYGEFLSRKLENMLKLMSIRTLGDEVKENRLSQQYSKDAALCSTVFRGEQCNFYGLLKHMESTDRQERREAFEAWAGLYESVSPKLDRTYDELVELRKKKAAKLGFSDYIEYIYSQRSRFDYGPADVERFRNCVRDIIVPVCAELYEKQRQRLGVDRLHYYDEELVFPEGNAVPIGTKDELVEKARRMYTEMSQETGEYFDFMCDHELFDLDTRPGKHMGGYCTFLPLYRAP